MRRKSAGLKEKGLQTSEDESHLSVVQEVLGKMVQSRDDGPDFLTVGSTRGLPPSRAYAPCGHVYRGN